MIGSIIDGYEIVDFVGKGSFGTVYKCKKNGKFYAIKFFNLDYIFDEYRHHGNDNRIIREIECLKVINHKNVIAYEDNGIFEMNKQKYIFVIMEYMDGSNLKEFLKENPISIQQAVEIFNQVLDGVEAIHAKGIIHRDLKLENIFLTKTNQIKILDFGLSKLIDFTSITSTGDQIGSPLYMAPEQIIDSKSVDYRSDYYALGVILFELITRQQPYGEIISREQLYYKILHEKPISLLQYVPSAPNNVDNLIFKLMEKSVYNRPNSIDEIRKYLSTSLEQPKKIISKFQPSFFLRTWNEKTVITNFYNDGYKLNNVIFPINHQHQQKGLLDFIRKSNISYFFDPATMRLAYDTFADVKGLVSLPYAPKGFDRLELDNLLDLDSKKEYVKLVVTEQVKYNPDYIVAPFHVSNNSNLVSIKNDDNENWFTLDVKLLKETKEYLITHNIDKPLVGGFCIKSEILTSKIEREYFLNVLSGLPCDLYWVYVDCIDYNSNKSQLYNYLYSMLKLQEVTNKPVIAGRIGTIGYLLLAFGLYGYECGAARFESFYEDLYKTDSDNYNMFVMYFIPELFKNIPISRKDPSKIISILKSKKGIDLKCNCPYCKNKRPDELISEPLTKLHFLYKQQEQIEILASMNISSRIDYIEGKIKKGIEYYKDLKNVFRESDYTFLKNWLSIIPDLRKEFGV